MRCIVRLAIEDWLRGLQLPLGAYCHPVERPGGNVNVMIPLYGFVIHVLLWPDVATLHMLGPDRGLVSCYEYCDPGFFDQLESDLRTAILKHQVGIPSYIATTQGATYG